ncbi:MAG: TIGR03905 family TSCPD domain-containing protein [Clostridia bacterium]|nr:TIGR03905 family TSCPD domain-containing protein [Clostridia bacterium]
MTITYQTKGTCSTKMTIEVEDDTVVSLKVDNGCSGNLQGISRLVAGMKVEDVVARLEGIRCGGKATSCPDQLARALREARA